MGVGGWWRWGWRRGWCDAHVVITFMNLGPVPHVILKIIIRGETRHSETNFIFTRTLNLVIFIADITVENKFIRSIYRLSLM